MLIEGQLYAYVYMFRERIKFAEIHYTVCGNVLQLFIQLHYKYPFYFSKSSSLFNIVIAGIEQLPLDKLFSISLYC